MKKKYILGVIVSIAAVNSLLYLLLYAELEVTFPERYVAQIYHPTCTCDPVVDSQVRQDGVMSLSASLDDETCAMGDAAAKHQSDLQVLDLYQKIKISYPQYVYTHTGWTQQYEISYSASQWATKKLKVFIVPFSHNDPGWLNTYNTYYTTSTRNILNEAVHQLSKDPMLSFTWAEVVFLERWYRESDKNTKDKFHKVLNSSQFEIVTGGWVMTDEAVSHYYGMLDQMIEGQQWLHTELGVRPQTAWALDPFGHSSTMAYLLKESGINNMLIQRVHYALKMHLAYNKQLEFKWRQVWDPSDRTDIFCHMTPFLLYNIIYSCGPDIQACCKFDFTRSKCWEWGKFVKAKDITADNIKSRAWELLDQWRKKAQLFSSDVLLVPHGDDFRYQNGDEWEKQTGNLKKLISYMNQHEDMAVQVEFGTLSQYFEAVKQTGIAVPSLSGDFHTYNDRDDQYWSGYFTSRPFLKHMVRHLQAKLRAAEILYTLTTILTLRDQVSEKIRNNLYELLVELKSVRQTHGLLQHHDAITGTAREYVVKDYLKQLHSALTKINNVLSTSTTFALAADIDDDLDLNSVKQAMEQTGPEQLPKPVVITVNKERKVSVYNPVTMPRDTVITVHVQFHLMYVEDVNGHPVPCQVNPVWINNTHMSDKEFQVAFEVKLLPLGITQYKIIALKHEDDRACQRANVRVFNANHTEHKRSVFTMRWSSVGKETFIIENKMLKLWFCPCTGLLQGVANKEDGIIHRTEMRMFKYGTGSWSNPWRDKSGAYVFMPDGPAKEVQYESPVVHITEGPVMSAVTTYLQNISQTISLLNVSGPDGASIHIDNVVNMDGARNQELAMRIHTDVDNPDDSFFVDSNGFQMMRRKTQNRLPLQGNFYPMTTSMFIEDELFRISLMSAQSHGVASLNQGKLEVILERRLLQDDWRGLSEGVTDSRVTLSQFQLVFETRKFAFSTSKYSSQGGFPSILGHTISHFLNNPPITMILNEGSKLHTFPYEPLNEPLPCDMHLVNLRWVMEVTEVKDALMVLHRQGVDCGFPKDHMGCSTSHGQLKWTDIFSQVRVQSIETMTLTGTKMISKPHHSRIHINPMDIKTYKVTLR